MIILHSTCRLSVQPFESSAKIPRHSPNIILCIVVCFIGCVYLSGLFFFHHAILFIFVIFFIGDQLTPLMLLQPVRFLLCNEHLISFLLRTDQSRAFSLQVAEKLTTLSFHPFKLMVKLNKSKLFTFSLMGWSRKLVRKWRSRCLKIAMSLQMCWAFDF